MFVQEAVILSSHQDFVIFHSLSSVNLPSKKYEGRGQNELHKAPKDKLKTVTKLLVETALHFNYQVLNPVDWINEEWNDSYAQNVACPRLNFMAVQQRGWLFDVKRKGQHIDRPFKTFADVKRAIVHDAQQFRHKQVPQELNQIEQQTEDDDPSLDLQKILPNPLYLLLPLEHQHVAVEQVTK